MLKIRMKEMLASAAVFMLAAIFLYSVGAPKAAPRKPPAPEDRKTALPLSVVLAKPPRPFEIDNRRLIVSNELDLYLARSHVKWTQSDKDDVIRARLEIETKYGYRPMLFMKIIKIESNFKMDAISKDGAMGLCQIQPDTARNISRRMGSPSIPNELLFDPVINLKLSAHYLNFLETKYKALPKALSAYNMGPGAFSKIYGEGGIPKGSYHNLLSEN
jgi:soluble lytic murein transglycosylase-like protein